MRQSHEIAELSAALAKANKRVRHAELDCSNSHFKKKYASLGSVITAIRVPFAEHGLSVLQSVQTDHAGFVTVTTRILHESGQWIEDDASWQMSENANIQQLGSAITYLRRYTLAAMGGITGDEDDDGESEVCVERPVAKPSRSPSGNPSIKREQPTEQPRPFKDNFPDSGDFTVRIDRVLKRKGKPAAIGIISEEYGSTLVATSVEGYADFLQERIGDEVTLGLERNGVALEIQRIRAAPPEQQSASHDTQA